MTSLLDLEYLAVGKSDIEAIDYLIKISKGAKSVKTASAWGVVAKVFEFWTRRWPNEWNEFASSIKDIKATRLRKDGKSKGGGIKYIGALPLRFERLIKAVFPEQKFDKKFVYKLVKNIEIIKVGERNDAFFYIPN